MFSNDIDKFGKKKFKKIKSGNVYFHFNLKKKFIMNVMVKW